jgi:hypothetical protein
MGYVVRWEMRTAFSSVLPNFFGRMDIRLKPPMKKLSPHREMLNVYAEFAEKIYGHAGG